MVIKSLSERFWEKVDIQGLDDCWEWTAGKTRGYGHIGVDGKIRQATHVLFYLRHGDWPPRGKEACHNCDNPGCLNPRHLYLGTHKSNMCDMVLRQRGRGGNQKGEQNNGAKLTENQVYDVRCLLAQGGITQKEIGQRFGISQQNVSRIVNHKRWRYMS